jgi:uncharacterized RDD family membrane protein YckC
MRCPKCHYLSFEPEARCRNCGYDFALAENDLVIKPVDEDDGPLQDFDLRAPAAAPQPMTPGPIHAASPMPSVAADLPARFMATMAPPIGETRPVLSPVLPPRPPMPRPVRPPSTTEMPLFMQGLPASADAMDAPLVQVPAAPRPPLAVRRRSPELSPEIVRTDRTSRVEAAAKLESVWAPLDAAPTTDGAALVEAAPSAEDDAFAGGEAAAGSRAAAAMVDLLLLGAIDLVVIWLTARVCAIGPAEVFRLPLVPLLAFFALVDVGYLFLFTATSGQTVGKMTAGIRVVPDDASDEAPLSMRQAAVRAIATLPSVAALGAGFIPALAGQGLAVHDRLAHTRVVRA